MRTLVLLIPLTLLLSSTAQAEDDFFEPAAMGMGGAVRNLAVDASAVHLNPAAMAGKPQYIAGSNYSFYGREKSHIIASGAFDSRTSNFALGTEYTVWRYSPLFEPETDLNWFPTNPDEDLEDKRHGIRLLLDLGSLQQRPVTHVFDPALFHEMLETV